MSAPGPSTCTPVVLGFAGCSKPWSGSAGSWDKSLGGGAGLGPVGTPEEALLEGREAARLADEDVGDLAHLDADEEHSIAGVLLVQALPERLWAGAKPKQPEPRQPLQPVGHSGPRAMNP